MTVAAEVPVIRPDWTAPARVHALCTTRAGGVSEAPYGTLNLGLHVGDEASRVRENRRRLLEHLSLPSSPTWLTQVHGTRVVGIGVGGGASAGAERGERAGTDDGGENGPIEADGAWTDRAAVVLGVLTADCLPVVVTDAAGGRVAVAHAGWRGLAGGVLASALMPFPRGLELHAWLGPAIGPRAFEVGAEVREAFVRRDIAHEEAFSPSGAAGTFLADLYALARGELRRDREDGAVRITGGQHCTVAEAACFHSYRRDGQRSGRMATVAWLE